MISGNNIYKNFNDINVLNGIDISIAQGEIVSIVGKSGAGKTTLLQILGTLEKPSSGSLLFNKKNVFEYNENQLADFRNKNIGFVFQAYNLIPVLTALENTTFILELQGVEKKVRNERGMELLKAVGLEDKANSRPNQLSGGQQQRVAVARALASRPRFVLADEPTANLDSKSTETLLDIMAELNIKEGTTFIFSTHDQRVIERARRIINLEDGQIK